MKNVLLTGQPGTGKTTIIKNVLAYIKTPAGGFYTQEIRQGGVRVGFEIVTLKGEKAPLAHANVKSPYKVGNYGVIAENIDRVAVASLKDALKENNLIVIDEIGKMELFSEEFKKTVISCLDSDNIVLGTVTEAKLSFAEEVSKRDDVHLIYLSAKNRNQVAEDLNEAIWELVKETL